MTQDKKKRRHGDDLRGASRLVVDAADKVTGVVEDMHRTIASGPALLGRPLEGPARGMTRLVYGSIRGITRAVGATIDVALGRLAPLLGESVPGPERAAVVAALNGVIGDYLVATGNPLATTMRLCHDGHPLDLDPPALHAALPGATGKVVVLVHGSSMSDRQWLRGGHDHGASLARDLGYTPVYVLYNSGLHISTNGKELAGLLERLTASWPAAIGELTIVGHSMGGLVARSACIAGDLAGHGWRRQLRRLVCIGSPHHGAPLERVGHVFQGLLGISPYSDPLSRLGRLRSAGVTDMRFGYVLDEHWSGRDRFDHGRDPRGAMKLPDGVACYAIAGTASTKPGGRRLGDGVVPVDSALGRHPRPELTLAFPLDHQWIGYGIGHLDLLARPEVYEVLHGWLASPEP